MPDMVDIVMSGKDLTLFSRVNSHFPCPVDHIDITALAYFNAINTLFKIFLLIRTWINGSDIV